MGKALTGLGAALLAVLVACSSGGGSSGGSGGRSQAAAGASTESYCQLTRSYVEKYNNPPPPTESPQAIRQVYEDAARDIRAAEAVAPGEIRSDVAVVADGLDRVIAVLARFDFDGAKLAEAPPDAFEGIVTPEFQTATQRVESFMRQECS